jgi:hypothetical protein
MTRTERERAHRALVRRLELAMFLLLVASFMLAVYWSMRQ